MSVQNIILLRTMISENDENDRRKEAKVLFEEMKDSTVVTWASMIASCYRAGKGDERIFRYKGYPMEKLTKSSTFLEVAYLLMYENLSYEGQLID